MILKASVDYGIRTILYLSTKEGVCSSREIAEEMSMPRDYLIQLALPLRKRGLIKARPGKNGGYMLAKPASKITLGEIINTFDDELKNTRMPMRKTRNANENVIAVQNMHKIVFEGLNDYLNAITVQDLLETVEAGGSSGDIIAHALELQAQKLRQK